MPMETAVPEETARRALRSIPAFHAFGSCRRNSQPLM